MCIHRRPQCSRGDTLHAAPVRFCSDLRRQRLASKLQPRLQHRRKVSDSSRVMCHDDCKELQSSIFTFTLTRRGWLCAAVIGERLCEAWFLLYVRSENALRH